MEFLCPPLARSARCFSERAGGENSLSCGEEQRTGRRREGGRKNGKPKTRSGRTAL